MIEKWQRAVPVFDVPLWTRPFQVVLGLGALAFGLVTYRELAGLGPASGMNDAYAWGIWKTFNTMTLTALGSGGFSIGIAAWLFRRSRLHVVMRTALLTSFFAYLSGLMLLGVDVGRPWNFYWIFTPWRWNVHSPLLEVAFCMPVYAMVPLLLENVPPVLDWVHENRPQYRPLVKKAESVMLRFYPFIVGLAYLLPAMHQSSLGALMLLGGDRVHPLWQTPWLPLFYLWAAAFMGFACVAGTLLFCSLMWKRPIDLDVLGEMNRITAGLIAWWLAFRFTDLIFRGQIGVAFRLNLYSGLFWTEVLFLVTAVFMLRDSARQRDARLMFHAHLIAAVGGMLYRFNPTTLAFQPKPGAFYFPTPIELLISVGFVSLAIAGFMFVAKTMAILPAPLRLWRRMEQDQSAKIKVMPRKLPGEQFATGD
jgi:Ni/Fe-hydrogenase subunit HybB-like protein